MGGAGRVTELLLTELHETPPPGKWILWGRPERIAPFRFADAAVVESKHDPRSLMGQRSISSVPSGDVVVYLHQIRPLRPGPSVTLIHDTIPLRYGGNVVLRMLKKVFFVSAAHLSRAILTVSAHSKELIHLDLGVPLDAITVLPLPADRKRAARIDSLRTTAARQNTLLYVGRFDRHKNLFRLCKAFERSEFAERGGRLALVGGWGVEVKRLQSWIERAGVGRVDVRGECSEAELDRLYASSTALIVPSLEEGYGLPAFEAAASGLPVAVSKTGAMTDLAGAVQFDASDVDSISRAIDVVTSQLPRAAPWVEESRLWPAFIFAITSAL